MGEITSWCSAAGRRMTAAGSSRSSEDRRKCPSTHSRLWVKRMAARGRRRRTKRATQQRRKTSTLKSKTELSTAGPANCALDWGAAEEAEEEELEEEEETLLNKERALLEKELNFFVSNC